MFYVFDIFPRRLNREDWVSIMFHLCSFLKRRRAKPSHTCYMYVLQHQTQRLPKNLISPPTGHLSNHFNFREIPRDPARASHCEHVTSARKVNSPGDKTLTSIYVSRTGGVKPKHVKSGSKTPSKKPNCRSFRTHQDSTPSPPSPHFSSCISVPPILSPEIH